MSKAVKKPRKKATNGYKMPDPLPKGEILVDVAKKQWKLGTSIGKGGFGEIYAAQEAGKSSTNYPYVIKVEPHGNGPLFVEMHFYMKNAKQCDIEAFMKKHKLKTFGMPVYLGSGSHEFGNNKYRFIVMEKFGNDIDQIRKLNKEVLPDVTVYQLAWQITYVLEYIHELGYVHADIKGGNVLLGATPATKNQAYLVDFGLATKYSTEKEFKPNPKKAHDGTIEYLSCDAHHGVPTRRGDFEILGYNIIHWLGGSLPWYTKLDDPKVVHQLKENNLSDIPKFIKTCLKENNDLLIKYFQYVKSLRFNEQPDYKKIRSLFEREIKKLQSTINSPLKLTNAKKRRSNIYVSADEQSDANTDSEENTEKVIPNKKRGKNPKENINIEKKEEVMTEAMKQVLARKQKKEAEKNKKTRTKKVNGELNSSDGIEGYNAEMIEINQRIKMGKKKTTNISEDRGDERPRRNLPTYNYDERTPKLTRKKL